MPNTLSAKWYLALLVLVVTSAHAENYEIIFDEGFYSYDYKKPTTDPDNKYLAKVTVKMGGREQIVVHGSTIPDSHLFYGNWHIANNPTSPSDEDIYKLDEAARLKVQTMFSTAEKTLWDLTSAAIDERFATVPVIRSGKYAFEMGYHRREKCFVDWQNEHPAVPVKRTDRDANLCHGIPYVPRLYGGGYGNDPYDPRYSSPSRAQPGGEIVSINRNFKFHFERKADGINIHDGRISLELKDSEGCLTIRPDEWPAFYAKLPTPRAWHEKYNQGVVVINRPRKTAPGPTPALHGVSAQ